MFEFDDISRKRYRFEEMKIGEIGWDAQFNANIVNESNHILEGDIIYCEEYCPTCKIHEKICEFCGEKYGENQWHKDHYINMGKLPS